MMDAGSQRDTHSPPTSDGADTGKYPGNNNRLTESVDLKSMVSDALSEYREWIIEPKRFSGIPFGFKKLDAMTGGLRPGSLHLIASHSSVGKSTLLLNVLEEICLNQKIRALFFCGDMAPLDVVKRFIFERSLLPRDYLRDEECQLTKRDLLRIHQYAEELMESGLAIIDQRDPTLDAITAIARTMHRQGGIGFIAMDHVHLIRPDDATVSAKVAMTQTAIGLKSLARELGLPILATAHLKCVSQNRPAEIRDLRHGNGLAHEAEFIGILQSMGEVQSSDHVVMNVVKNHFGPCGQLDLYRHRRLLRFCEQPPLTEEEEERMMA